MDRLSYSISQRTRVDTMPRRLEERHSALREEVRSALTDEMITITTELLLAYSDSMDPKDLYELVIPPGDYQTMVDASMLMPKRPSYLTDRIFMDTYCAVGAGYESQRIEYSIAYIADKRVGWLYPAILNPVRPDNLLGHKLLPLVDIAIQAQTSIRLMNLMFREVNSVSLIMHMLPWLRLIALRVKPDRSQLKTYLHKIANIGTPRFVPGVSRWFGEACKYGTELVSLHSITKKKTDLDKGAIIVPVLDENLVEDGLVDHFNEFTKEIVIDKHLKPYNYNSGVLE
jgi:hypothetical protein